MGKDTVELNISDELIETISETAESMPEGFEKQQMKIYASMLRLHDFLHATFLLASMPATSKSRPQYFESAQRNSILFVETMQKDLLELARQASHSETVRRDSPVSEDTNDSP